MHSRFVPLAALFIWWLTVVGSRPCLSGLRPPSTRRKSCFMPGIARATALRLSLSDHHHCVTAFDMPAWCRLCACACPQPRLSVPRTGFQHALPRSHLHTRVGLIRGRRELGAAHRLRADAWQQHARVQAIHTQSARSRHARGELAASARGARSASTRNEGLPPAFDSTCTPPSATGRGQKPAQCQ